MTFITEIHEAREDIKELEAQVEELRQEEPESVGQRITLRAQLTAAENLLEEARTRLEDLRARQKTELDRNSQEKARARMDEIRAEAQPLDDAIRDELLKVEKVLQRAAKRVLARHEELGKLATEYHRCQVELGVERPKPLGDFSLLMPISRNRHDDPPQAWAHALQITYWLIQDMSKKSAYGLSSAFAGHFPAPNTLEKGFMEQASREPSLADTLESL
ncbi:MAG TPA: hypothetical protein VF168_12380 [Trueperaceae bacterium]